MNDVNYDLMTDLELKQYFLAHRHDEEAFQAYLSRHRKRDRKVITKVGDPDFDSKLQAEIDRQIQFHQNSSRST